MATLWERLADAEVIDLAHPLERGIPVSPNHPAYQYAMMRRHGDMVRVDGGSAANDMFVLGGHVGTHIDALGHVSQDGYAHGGVPVSEIQTNTGLTRLGIDQLEPFVCRGVLLDVARLHGVDCVADDYEVTADDLEAAADVSELEVGPGDAVLIRTGWSARWDDVERFRGQVGGAPGPGVGAAQWLIDRGVRVAGAETIAFEVIRPGAGHATLPVHRMLLVEAGINLIEVMDLSRLAESGHAQFALVIAPLKLVGGTGSPFRPIALVDGPTS